MTRRNWWSRPPAPTGRVPAKWRRGCLISSLVIVVLMLIAGAVLGLRPDLAAQGADMLRAVAGDEVVARLEDTVFAVRDWAQQQAYQLGMIHASAPWDSGTPAVARAATPRPTAPPASATPTPHGTPALARPNPTATVAPPTPTPTEWQPDPLPDVGTMDGAGQWSAYLTDPAGHVVAYRTFVQPDPKRPYVYAAVVAMNLRAMQVHFVLGTEEPISKVKIARKGKIPEADLQGGQLLAAFNGGFKARHGHFGAMIDGVTVLPPIDGLGTIALYQGGQIRIGAWGRDIMDSPGMVAWRQNGPLLIDDGAINPHTKDQTSRDWGIILNGVTAVERSGVGISADGSVLYYVAGDSLILPRLADTFAMIHAESAIQLDINSIYVRFDAFQATPSGLTSSPLLDAMKGERQRYLHPWSRDFFYLTAAGDAAVGPP